VAEKGHQEARTIFRKNEIGRGRVHGSASKSFEDFTLKVAGGPMRVGNRGTKSENQGDRRHERILLS